MTEGERVARRPLPAEICVALVGESEDLVCGVMSGSRSALADFFRRPINTFGVFAVGTEQMFLTAFACVILAIVGCLVIVAGHNVGLLNEAKVAEVVYAWLTICVAAFSFPLPSRVARQKNLRSNVERAARRLAAMGDITRDNIHDVHAYLSETEKASRSAAAVMWWIPGVVWAAGVYLLQRGVDQHDGSMFGVAFVAFLFAGFGAFVLAAYRRGSSLVYAVAQGVLHLRKQAMAERRELDEARARRRNRCSRRVCAGRCKTEGGVAWH